jgi:hypothetical protein
MSVRSNSTDRPSEDVTNASNVNADKIVADELYPLLDAVDSKSIADEFRIGVHSDKRDFTSYVQVAICEGPDPSSSLAELENKTAVDDSLEHMPKSRFSELTDDRDYRAVVRLLFELLHTPQVSHQRAIQRKRLEWLTRGVVAADATNLELTRSVVVSDDFVGDDEDIYEIDTDGSGVELHCAARVNSKHRHPLGATVTEGDTHESPQFDHLEDNSRSSQISTRLSGRLTVRTRAISDSMRSTTATMTSSHCCTQTPNSKSSNWLYPLKKLLNQESLLMNRHGSS